MTQTAIKTSACEPCAAAEENAGWHGFNTQCHECKTRHLAHLQMFFESQQAKSITPAYMAALTDAFGEAWKAGHEQVKAWAVRIAGARKS